MLAFAICDFSIDLIVCASLQVQLITQAFYVVVLGCNHVIGK